MTQQIAVIGSGIAGLASAWLLAPRHQVTLIERNDYIGGHTHTINVAEDGRNLAVDTGFIVYNEPNYPLLTRLFERLQVATRASDMSFSASIGPGDLEYAGDSLDSLFAQRRNLWRPSFLRMLADILRFNRRCRACLEHGGFANLTLGEFLDRERLGRAFRDDYLLPMAAAIWSCPTVTMLDFPAESLARFFANHGLIDLLDRPVWRTVAGGSQRYVDAMLADIGADRVIQDGARRVRRLAQGVEVLCESGATRVFDTLILACHADEALALLDSPTADEAELLGRFRYQPNHAYLHRDARMMPRRRAVWSSWNYLATHGRDGRRAVSVTYWMNRLQGLTTHEQYFVTLNPIDLPAPDTLIADMVYHHPVFDRAAMDAQPRLELIQGRNRIWYCGSYFGYGFHEDALRSAVAIAGQLGAATGWLAQGAAASTARDARARSAT